MLFSVSKEDETQTDRQKRKTEMKAWVSVQKFGDYETCVELCEYINSTTFYHAILGSNGNVVIQCRQYELGQLLAILAADEKTNWIEYTVQFEC